MRLVLRGDADTADARIDRVGQREIDDPRLAAEIDRRLGARIGQLHQATATATGENIGHRIACQWLSAPQIHPSSPLNLYLQRVVVSFGFTRSYSSSCNITVASGGRVTQAAPSFASTPPRLPSPDPQ